MPGKPRSRTPFPMARYRAHEGEVSLHMSHFFAGYLKDIYRLFEGDLALVIVLAEVAHHNLAVHFSSQEGLESGVEGKLERDEAFRRRLNACNAFSLAGATGLPRETVRRKLLRLEELGWIERCGRRDVRITPRPGEHFFPDFNVKLVTGLLETARRIRELICDDRPKPGTPSGGRR